MCAYLGTIAAAGTHNTATLLPDLASHACLFATLLCPLRRAQVRS